MKHMYIILSTILTHVNSYVITTNVTSGKSFEESKYDIKTNEKEHESLKTFSDDERGVYLDDVLYALKSQNWTSGEVPCLNQTLQVLHNLQNFTLWAVWQWDSISSEPQGLLYGNKFHLGNFDQCMGAPWHESHPDLQTQYCLADIVLERSDKYPRKRNKELYNPHQSALDVIEHRSLFMRPLNYLTWGICVPSSCQPHSVQRLLGTLLAHSHLGAAGLRARISVTEPCQSVDKPREYDFLFYSFIVFTSLFTAAVILCTFLRLHIKESNRNTIRDKLLKAICLKNNGADILKVNKGGVDVFYGIRFLSMCLIALDHQMGISNAGPISNGAQVDEAAVSFSGLLVLHNDLFVDTFFVLSGFLSATALSAFKKLPNLLVIILKRYVRLTVAYAYIIYYVCAVYPFTGSGPLWHRAIASETDQCRKNWWLSLLMLNNYIDSENICIVITWYIPCDFHFFIVTVLLYWLYRTLPKAGVACAIAVSICAVIAPGLINYYHQLPPVQLFTYDFISNPRGHHQFHLSYIKSHARYASYLVGFFSGLLFSYYKATGNVKRISQKYSVLGACVALVVMFGVMIYGATFVWSGYEVVGGTVYAAIERPLYACSITLLVLCCSMGHLASNFIFRDIQTFLTDTLFLLTAICSSSGKSFLSWYPWAPLSRLSYGMYLTHTLIISRNVFSTRVSQRADTFLFLIEAAGVIVLGCVVALYMLLIFELPVNNLLNLCLKQKSKAQGDEKCNNSLNNKSDNVGTDNKVYAHENLPSPANIISKF